MQRIQNKCWQWNGNHYVPIGLATCSSSANPGIIPLEQQTYVEYEVNDINGDGYPDLIFNTHAIGWVHSPEPEGWQGQILLQTQQMSRLMPMEVGNLPNGVAAFLNVAGVAVKTGTDPFSTWFDLLPAAACGVGKWTGAEQQGSPAGPIDRLQSSVCSIADANGDGIPDWIVEDGFRLGTGHGFNTVEIRFPSHRAHSVQRMDFIDVCTASPSTESAARQVSGLRDITGDGIPDFIVSGDGIEFRVYVGTGSGFTVDAIDVESFSLSHAQEKCDGSSSSTRSGLFDFNGDGHPDVVSWSGSVLSVLQLAGGEQPGRPEAGRITSVDTGHGAVTNISYASAKEDSSTRHQVPFPEIVVSSIQTVGMRGLSGTLAPMSYAYGNIEMFYDSTLDAFRSTGYLRRVELVSSPWLGDLTTQTAKITDSYPLDPITAATLPTLTTPQRFGRYLRVGRVSDVTTLAGSLGTDAKALLTIDVTSDARRIAGVHHGIETTDTRVFSGPAVPANDICKDVAFPYNYALSESLDNGSYKPCVDRGFLFTKFAQSWRGSAAPPSVANVQSLTTVRSVDSYGRVLSILYQNDLFRTDDDVCVDTVYANWVNRDMPILTAMTSRAVTTCTKQNKTYAQEYWEYDHLFLGTVSQGLPTSHTVLRYTADTGSYLGTVREFDVTYDAAANPTRIVSTREDGGTRTVDLTYDAFGLSSESSSVHGSAGPTLLTTRLFDPITDDLRESTDENGTVRGTTYDGFGRPLLDTIATPGGAPGVLAARSYISFDGVDANNEGRRITTKEFTDPVQPNAVASTPGKTSTAFFDELGRARHAAVELGEDYANEMMIVGSRVYDSLGRVVFERDPFKKSQNPTTAYGTSRIFDVDGSLMAEIRGSGPQAYTTTPSVPAELFPTLYRHTFSNHLETKVVQGADGLTAGLPQNGVTREATLTAIGRVLSRSTWKGGIRLEHEALGYDQLGHHTSLVRYQNAAAGSNPVATSWQFDSLGQMLWLNEPTSAPQARTYSDWGELKATAWYPTSPEPIHAITMKYDELGRLLASDELNGGVIDPSAARLYSYDVPGSSPFASPTYLTGRLAAAETPTGKVVLSYDGFGNVNARSYSDAATLHTYFEKHEFHGDGSHEAIELKLPDNAYQPERMEYGYDSAGRARWMWFSDGSNTQEIYNATNVDAWGRTRVASYGQTDFAASYAEVGRRLPQNLSLTSPHGTRGITYTGFDPVGRELSRTEALPNSPGTHTQSYDPLGRIQGMRTMQGSTTTALWTFAYDALGNVANLNDQLGTADATLSYLTTDRDQLCGVAYSGAPSGCNVVHDSFGNITYEPTRTGHNQLSYFNSGDVRGIENEAGVTATFQYDAFGDVQNLSIFNGSVELRRDRHYGPYIAERSQKAQASTLYLSRQFPGPDVSVSRRGPTGPWIYEFSESRGTRITTDENGTFVQDLSYTPFGRPTSSGAQPGTPEFTNDQWNGGDALDGFGLVRLGKRIYDPSIGRFLSRDPLITPRTATTSNPYAFALNDPMNLSDPSGLDPCSGSPTCIWGSTNDDPVSTGVGLSLAVGSWTIGYLSSGRSEPKTEEGADLYVRATIANGISPPPSPPNFNWDSLARSGASGSEALSLAAESEEATVGGAITAAADRVTTGFALGIATLPLIPARLAAAFSIGLGAKDIVSGIYHRDGWQILGGVSTAGLGFLGLRSQRPVEQPVEVTPDGRYYSVAYEHRLGANDYGRRRGVHENRSNAALHGAMTADSGFAAVMEGIIPGVGAAVSKQGGRQTPGDWTWHHNVAEGVMQLVPRSQHRPGSMFQRALHPDGRGGYSLWAKPAGAP